MRHIISIILQNEAGALTRVAGLFSTRGYNIESLNVAPTAVAGLSRITLVTTGSDGVIRQICNQLLKLIDVVDLVDLTDGPHFERELLVLKLRIDPARLDELRLLFERERARVLDDRPAFYTVELSAASAAIDDFIEQVRSHADIITTARSGVVAAAVGEPRVSYVPTETAVGRSPG